MGFDQVRKLKQEADERKEAYGKGYVPFFAIADGESVEVWFNGTEDEPHIIHEHSIKRGQQFMSETCAKHAKGHDGCVPCYLNTNGDAGVGKPGAKAVFNVVDTRWVHKQKDAEKSQEGKDRFTYTPCEDDSSCKLCKRKVAREHAGQKRWTMSMTWAMALDGINQNLKKRCTCGGKIRDGECSKCNDPTPGSIFNCPITVTRTGKMTNTSYQFVPGAFEDMPDWVAKLEPADLEAATKPRSSEAQAERLGVQNPFSGFSGGKKGARSYGGDDDDDEIFGASKDDGTSEEDDD